MAKKNKLVTSAVAIATAAALMLGGTFAWQSINQTALNEASDVINPGGRLHDDFDGSNKDVYVENFADEDIFARVRLEEYFEIVLNHGTAGEKTVNVVGNKTQQTDEDGNGVVDQDDKPVYDYTYIPYIFGTANEDGTYNAAVDTGDPEDAADDTPYWTWTTGGSTTFMPTFNKNKDSLAADLNGNYVDAIGGISNRDDEQYTGYVDYTLAENSSKTANAIYDIDANMADELTQGSVDISDLIANGILDEAYENNVSLVFEEHTAKATGEAELISMEDWLAMVEEDGGYDEEKHGNYWVYDTDGWVYWSAPIGSGEATGLLLDSIELSGVMDDTWYYAINVVAQFITAGDMGSVEDGTGFYDTDNGTVPSKEALELLEKIGVNDTASGGSSATDPDPDNYQTLTLTTAGDDEVVLSYGEPVIIAGEEGADLSSIKMTDVDGNEFTEFSYDQSTGVLSFYGYNSPYTVTDASSTYTGTIEVYTSMDQIQLYTSIRDLESPDTGETSFVKPNQQYDLYVELTPEEVSLAPEGFDITSATPVLSFTGTPIAGEEYTLDDSDYTLGEWTTFTYGSDEEYDVQYYRATTTITFNSSVTYGTTIGMTSTIEGFENDFASWDDYVVSDLEVDWNDVTIALYDQSGTELTANIVQPNTTYDIVVSMLYGNDTLVIYSSNSARGTVSDRVSAEVQLDLYTHFTDMINPQEVINFEINENGQLVVGQDVDPNSTEYGDDVIIDDLGICFCIGDLLIDGNTDNATHCYVYDERDMYFAGEEPFTIEMPDADDYNYESYYYVILNDGPKQVTVGDGLDWEIRNDITDEVTFTIEGRTDENTKIEKAEDGRYYLTLGDNETSAELTLTAAIDGVGKGTMKVKVVYATVQVSSGTLTEVETWLELNATGAGEYTFSLKEDTAATWSMDEENATANVTFNSETGVLTVTDNGSGGASCSLEAIIYYGDGEEDYVLIAISVYIEIPVSK